MSSRGLARRLRAGLHAGAPVGILGRSLVRTIATAVAGLRDKVCEISVSLDVKTSDARLAHSDGTGSGRKHLIPCDCRRRRRGRASQLCRRVVPRVSRHRDGVKIVMAAIIGDFHPLGAESSRFRLYSHAVVLVLRRGLVRAGLLVVAGVGHYIRQVSILLDVEAPDAGRAHMDLGLREDRARQRKECRRQKSGDSEVCTHKSPWSRPGIPANSFSLFAINCELEVLASSRNQNSPLPGRNCYLFVSLFWSC